MYFSVGGGFVVDEDEIDQLVEAPTRLRVPYPFTSAVELLLHGETAHKRIPDMMRINEFALRSPEQVRAGPARTLGYHECQHRPRHER